MRLEGKVAIVSGAASGMGAAMARRFAKEGAKVVIPDMLEEEGRRVSGRNHARQQALPNSCALMSPMRTTGKPRSRPRCRNSASSTSW